MKAGGQTFREPLDVTLEFVQFPLRDPQRSHLRRVGGVHATEEFVNEALELLQVFRSSTPRHDPLEADGLLNLFAHDIDGVVHLRSDQDGTAATDGLDREGGDGE